jgi:hypothetical protein
MQRLTFVPTNKQIERLLAKQIGENKHRKAKVRDIEIQFT